MGERGGAEEWLNFQRQSSNEGPKRVQAALDRFSPPVALASGKASKSSNVLRPGCRQALSCTPLHSTRASLCWSFQCSGCWRHPSDAARPPGPKAQETLESVPKSAHEQTSQRVDAHKLKLPCSPVPQNEIEIEIKVRHFVVPRTWLGLQVSKTDDQPRVVNLRWNCRSLLTTRIILIVDMTSLPTYSGLCSFTFSSTANCVPL